MQALAMRGIFCAQNVDVGFILQGHKVKYIRGLALTTTWDSSLPIAMEIDRAYA